MATPLAQTLAKDFADAEADLKALRTLTNETPFDRKANRELRDAARRRARNAYKTIEAIASIASIAALAD